MTYYPEKVHRRSCQPRFTGLAEGVNAVGTDVSFECGCFVRMSLAISAATKRIEKAGFASNGCGFMLAAADRLAEIVEGRELTSLHSFDEAEFREMMTGELGVFPTERRPCLEAVLEAFRSALADHRAYLIEEFRGEKALICTCFGVTEEAIEAFVLKNSPRSVEEVTAGCRAGGGCGSCIMLIQEFIDANASL